ncbi:hypothetical protein [Massilia sp. NR 4-1]|uniref:hypothetical protein n=1 Tax=Massilia sp. NR 4-1 TaxID=1678028 RepID=UPI00067CB666|nr:hypothetical protein [Massilia sp. NR 4-1]AKU24081.1 hypothetical protein ACZ75_24155 [Massilia sp. NR 4-1]
MQKSNDIQLAQANTDPGFKIPGGDKPAQPGSQPAASASAPAGTPAAPDGSNGGLSGTPPASGIEVAPVAGAPATDTSSRDLIIGGGIFVVLLIIFVFVRNAFANHLVKRRVAPSSADTAGWLLFCGLSFLSAAAVLGIINSDRFLSVAITGTLLVFGIASLVGAALTGRR